MLRPSPAEKCLNSISAETAANSTCPMNFAQPQVKCWQRKTALKGVKCKRWRRTTQHEINMSMLPNILFGKWDEVPSKQHHACMQSLHGFSRHEQPKIGYWNRNPRKHFYPVYGVVQALLCPQDLVLVEATNLATRPQSKQHRSEGVHEVLPTASYNALPMKFY